MTRLINVDIPAERIWEIAPFAWLFSYIPRERERIAKRLFAGWCAARELNVVRSPDSEADRIIEGKRVEIKLSTLWAVGRYKFQQIRDQNYDYVVCLGISPSTAHAWILSKHVLLQHVIGNKEFSQHRGRRGSDTYWLNVDPQHPLGILSKQSGRLSEVYRVLSQ